MREFAGGPRNGKQLSDFATSFESRRPYGPDCLIPLDRNLFLSAKCRGLPSAHLCVEELAGYPQPSLRKPWSFVSSLNHSHDVVGTTR
jgi:hypothetical protein